MIEFFLSLFQLIMLVNGQPLNVSTIPNDSLRRLRHLPAIALCFPNSALYVFPTVHTYGVSYTTVSSITAYAAFSLALLCFTWQVFSVLIRTRHYL